VNPSSIRRLVGRQILDSRGRPTVEVDVHLADGSMGRASAPSGASTGRHEAHELRDGDRDVYEGRGVLKAVAHVGGEIAAALLGRDGLDQRGADAAMRAADGTANLARFGANAVLAASLAIARAAAAHRRAPLHVYLAGLDGGLSPSLPLPMTNIFSGGAHAWHAMDFQDFLVVPVGAASIGAALRTIEKVRAGAHRLMAEAGLPVLLAEEGGLSPGYERSEAALDLMMRVFAAARLEPFRDVAIALDVAASELVAESGYDLKGEKRRLTSAGMADYVAALCTRYPIVSVEDPLGEDDWEGWRKFTAEADALQIVGDDLFVTNAARIEEGARRGAANAVLVKLNQNGTLSGTLDAMAVARRAGYATVVSARSGETEDAFMSDFAVATGAGQIKIGSVRNSERLAKYNQLIRIAEDETLPFAGRAALAGAAGRRAR
jgi:enolase